MLKQTQKHEFLLILAQIKRALSQKRSIIVIKKKKYKYFSILKLMSQLGYIQSFEERGDFFFLKIKETYICRSLMSKTLNIQKMMTSSQKKKKHNIQSKIVNRIQRYKGQAFTFICNSHLGITSGSNLIKNNVGGQILFQIV
jgi:ribosomal protein S8